MQKLLLLTTRSEGREEIQRLSSNPESSYSRGATALYNLLAEASRLFGQSVDAASRISRGITQSLLPQIVILMCQCSLVSVLVKN